MSIADHVHLNAEAAGRYTRSSWRLTPELSFAPADAIRN